jgi:hypothetical protein
MRTQFFEGIWGDRNTYCTVLLWAINCNSYWGLKQNGSKRELGRSFVSSDVKRGQQQFDKIGGCAIMNGELTAFDGSYVKAGSVDTNCDSLEYFP